MVTAPCAGSGSLLLKFAKIVGVENVGSFYGQEINLKIYNLCRINMFLRDVNFSNFDIARGVTLSAPAHWHAQLFDAIVSNPPYSMKWEGRTIQRSYLIRVLLPLGNLHLARKWTWPSLEGSGFFRPFVLRGLF